MHSIRYYEKTAKYWYNRITRMPAFYDFFRKIKLMPNNVNIEADSTTDTATFVAGTNLQFTIDDAVITNPNTTDQVTIDAADFATYIPLGTTSLRLEKTLGATVSTSSEVEIYADPLSPILVTRTADNQLTISANSPTLPFSREQIEDFQALMLTSGTHTNITVTYNDNGTSPGTLDLASTDTLETVTGRGASSTNAITISNATGSSSTITGALKVTAGGLCVFENINAGGYVSGNTLTSTVATGTAPLTVTSTTEVANLRAATASKWHTARTVTFSGGDVSGSFSIDGSGDVSGVALTVDGNTVALGTDTTGNYVATGATSGNGISGSTSSEGATFTVSSNATALNTAETIVFRDASGNFAAGTITANLTGNADTVTNGVYTTGSYSDPTWLTLSKSKVGLGNVENTALSTSTHYIGTTSITYNRASASQTLTGVSIDGNAGTVTNGFYTSSSFNLGTTSIAVNRASGTQSLTGISIDGNAGTVTNGVYTTGSYSDPTWLTLSATKVGLGNVTNESKATMFTNPTFTGNFSAGTNTSSTVRFNVGTGTPASAVSPTGYMVINVNGTNRYVPYYT